MTKKFLGPYEILSVLGRGGMGTVFKGRNDTTGEVVAIKALSHASSDETHFRGRFESEIQALLKLNHPNIVRILSFGQEKGTLFFAMEMVEGKSLFHLQREVKKFDWREVLVIARDVASALRHAHDRGIIHRDLKPGNLMKSSKEGIIKVADFGIAKSFGSSHDTRDNVIGTLDFMSPEQASGKPVTVRSDLYSLGAVLYTLLAGQPPFASNSIEESLRNLTRVPAPPVRERVANVPEELEMLIAELLEKKPENRTSTAYALLRKLDYVEQVLRDSSEAKTAHGLKAPNAEKKTPPTKPSLNDDENFLLEPPDPEGELSEDKTKHSKPKSSSRAKHTKLNSETVVDQGSPPFAPEQELQLKEPEVRQDYFSTVSEQQLGAQFHETEHSTAHRGIGLLPIFIMFLAVVGLGGYATYYALMPPSAESLYEKIAASAQNPSAVRAEMNQFLKIYPEDERVAKVQELVQLADARALHNLLSVRSRLPGNSRLSAIETKFVDVVDAVDVDVAAGLEKLQSFVTLYENDEDISGDEIKAVIAAKEILADAKPKVDQQIQSVREKIKKAMRQAENDPAQSFKIYRSIIEIYGNLDYADDLVQVARDAIVD